IAPGREDVLSNALPHREGEMLWPHARIRHARNVEILERVAAARRETPESEAWLGLLEAAFGESEDGAPWAAGVPRPAADRPVKAPVLSHTEITLDGRAARDWVRRLLKLTPTVNPRRIDGLALLEAAVCHDDARLDALAAAGGEQTRKIEICHTCKGYVKAVTTVRPLAPWAVLLDDLTTVPLDVAALERGYRRPERPGYPLECRITKAGGGGWWRLWRMVEAVTKQPPPTSTNLPNLHQPPPVVGA